MSFTRVISEREFCELVQGNTVAINIDAGAGQMVRVEVTLGMTPDRARDIMEVAAREALAAAHPDDHGKEF